MSKQVMVFPGGSNKRVWLSRYFNLLMNPDRNPFAPAIMVETLGKRYRGYYLTGMGRWGFVFDPKPENGPWGYVETSARLELWFDDEIEGSGPEKGGDNHAKETRKTGGEAGTSGGLGPQTTFDKNPTWERERRAGRKHGGRADESYPRETTPDGIPVEGDGAPNSPDSGETAEG